MKKYLLIILLLFTLNSTYAVNVEYSDPIFDDINEFLDIGDIEPGYNPQLNYPIGIYKPYENQGVAQLTATAFCDAIGQTYISHTLENKKHDVNGTLYYPSSLTWWDHNKKVKKFTAIVCDDGNIDAGGGTSGTGSTFIINNIDSDQGINKKIFDIETITEIYQYEALIMVFILLYTFFMRVIGARAKKQKVLGL